ncbi:MAG: hypothetical protein IH892_02980 [Planctomycetes bacterium]|nr:hypothetical protein [Planctomycetota bacterium]
MIKGTDYFAWIYGIVGFVVFSAISPVLGQFPAITESPDWRNTITFERDSFYARSLSSNSPTWIKFMILLEPYDSNLVYFQNSRRYVFHYEAANALIEPFKEMSAQQFNEVSLFEETQQVILGTVIVPPISFDTREPLFAEYGIQFVRQDPYPKEQLRNLFNLVKDNVLTSSHVQAFYFPTFEQEEVTQDHAEWFESQGIALGSTARWVTGNTCYSKGWALGELKYVTANSIDTAYRNNELKPTDILLTDGIPAELPYLSGIISLVPSTPNSHVVILARAYSIPFVHLALQEDADLATELEGHKVLYSAFDDFYGMPQIKLISMNDILDDATADKILELKQPVPLSIAAMKPYGAYSVSTMGLTPSDIQYVGGKAANFGILRQALPEHSPNSLALTFDVWNAFLDQMLAPTPKMILKPNQHILFWADNDPEEGSTHVGFRLSKKGEQIILLERDGKTVIDSVTFGPQATDRSYGRATDGSPSWQFFLMPTPGLPNTSNPIAPNTGLVINELMADNKTSLEDPDNIGTHPDWFELYNGSSEEIVLNGLYLTDDINDLTRWQIPFETSDETLREEIFHRLSKHEVYPPENMQELSHDLAFIRTLFINQDRTLFSDELSSAILSALTDPNIGFNPHSTLRFRSSTNVEDGDEFVGAGLYGSYSGCLSDSDTSNEAANCSVFKAIRKTFSSFYNTNAFLERLRHHVNENEVGMALLVHHSFPDNIELANGVATVETMGPNANTVITLVSQLGAVSVTNPEDSSAPEEVTLEILPSGSVVPARIRRASSLVPLGGTVMTWQDDYLELFDLLLRVSDTFSQTTGKTKYVLDLEYKKMAAGDQTLPLGGLVIKQVREVPLHDEAPEKTPFLINIPTEYEIFTGEFELDEEVDVFADHRLKSRWTIETKNIPLDSNRLQETIYHRISIEYINDDHIESVNLDMNSATHAYADNHSIDSWQFNRTHPRTYQLDTTNLRTTVAATSNPIFTIAELGTNAFNIPTRCLTLDVTYIYPVASSQGITGSMLRQTVTNHLYLWPRGAEPSADDIYQERSLSQGNITVNTSFFYPTPPGNLSSWVGSAGTTAPLKRWKETNITGLTSETIVLKGYYSQTLRPEHHNYVEHFLFEPQLEPNISNTVLEELRTGNIRFIYMIIDHQGHRSGITTYGFEVE